MQDPRPNSHFLCPKQSARICPEARKQGCPKARPQSLAQEKSQSNRIEPGRKTSEPRCSRLSLVKKWALTLNHPNFGVPASYLGRELSVSFARYLRCLGPSKFIRSVSLPQPLFLSLMCVSPEEKQNTISSQRNRPFTNQAKITSILLSKQTQAPWRALLEANGRHPKDPPPPHRTETKSELLLRSPQKLHEVEPSHHARHLPRGLTASLG